MISMIEEKKMTFFSLGAQDIFVKRVLASLTLDPEPRKFLL